MNDIHEAIFKEIIRILNVHGSSNGIHYGSTMNAHGVLVHYSLVNFTTIDNCCAGSILISGDRINITYSWRGSMPIRMYAFSLSDPECFDKIATTVKLSDQLSDQ